MHTSNFKGLPQTQDILKTRLNDYGTILCEIEIVPFYVPNFVKKLALFFNHEKLFFLLML